MFPCLIIVDTHRMLATIKVVEYDRGGYRIQQTSELRINASAVLNKLKLPAPPKLLSVGPVPDEPTDRAEAELDGQPDSDIEPA